MIIANQVSKNCRQTLLKFASLLVIQISLLTAPALAFALSTVNLTSVEENAAEFGQVAGSFTVARTDDGNIGATLRVHVMIQGSATIDADYQRSGVGNIGGEVYYVDIYGGQLTRTISLVPILDNLIEGDENVLLTLQDFNSTYIVGDDNVAEISISDDVTNVTLKLDDGVMTEFGQTPGSFTLTRSENGNIGAGIRVHVIMQGSATIDVDYQRSGVGNIGGEVYYVDIYGGQLTRTISLVPILDNLIEGEEAMSVQLQDIGVGYTANIENTIDFILADDVTNVTLKLDDGVMTEFGQTPGSFTLTRSENGNIGAGIRVHVIMQGSATIDVDYQRSGVGNIGGEVYYVDIYGGQLTRTISLVPILDNLIEGEEAMSVQLQDIGVGYTANIENTIDFTLADDVTNVTLKLDDGVMTEFGQTPGSFTLTRSENGNIGAGIRVHVIMQGSATIDVDYQRSGVGNIGGEVYYVDIYGGQLTRTISLVPILDNLIEGEEAMSVQLQDIGVGYTANIENTIDFILADDVTNVTLKLDDGVMTEFGQTPGSFTLTRSENGNIGAGIRVHVIMQGSATIDVDYQRSGVGNIGGEVYYVDIYGGQLTRTISLVPILDNLIEDDENVTIQLKDIGVAYTATNENTIEMLILDFREVIFKDSLEDL